MYSSTASFLQQSGYGTVYLLMSSYVPYYITRFMMFNYRGSVVLELHLCLKYLELYQTMFVTSKVIATFCPNLRLSILTLHFITISSDSCTAPLSYGWGAP